MRFCKKIGYAGYAEFRYSVAQYLFSGPATTNIDESWSRLIEGYTGCIQKIPSTLTKDKIDAFAHSIIHAQLVRVFGIHESGLAAKYLTYRLAALGFDSEEVTSTAAFDAKSRFARKGDLFIFFSISGISNDIVSSISTANNRGASCALFTINQKAPQAAEVDHFMLLPSFDIDRTTLFLDSQAICLISIDLIISRLAALLKKN